MGLFSLFKSRTEVRIGEFELPSYLPPAAAEEFAIYISSHSSNLKGRYTGRYREKNAHLTPEEREEFEKLRRRFIRQY